MVAIPVVLSLALGQWTGVFAQNQAVAHKPFALTIENIMRGPGLYGYEPNAVRWSGDGHRGRRHPTAEQPIERFDPIGKQFDPHAHQAMDRLETTDHEDGTIVQVFQPGYMFHGRVLRPAMVRVAVNAAPASNKTVN